MTTEQQADNLRKQAEELRDALHMARLLCEAWEAKGSEETWFSVPASELRYILRNVTP